MIGRKCGSEIRFDALEGLLRAWLFACTVYRVTVRRVQSTEYSAFGRPVLVLKGFGETMGDRYAPEVRGKMAAARCGTCGSGLYVRRVV